MRKPDEKLAPHPHPKRKNNNNNNKTNNPPPKKKKKPQQKTPQNKNKKQKQKQNKNKNKTPPKTQGWSETGLLFCFGQFWTTKLILLNSLIYYACRWSYGAFQCRICCLIAGLHKASKIPKWQIGRHFSSIAPGPLTDFNRIGVYPTWSTSMLLMIMQHRKPAWAATSLLPNT